MSGQCSWGATPDEGLSIIWSQLYRQEWDATPHAYVNAGVVAPGRSRRLAKIVDETLSFKAYLGVQHFEPARWHLAGEPAAKFFASFFLRGRTVTLRTFPAMTDALAAVRAFHATLVASQDGDPSV